MSATRDGKMWRCQFYYKDWQGVSHKKNKRGFKTKAEAEQWERDFLQQQQRNLDISYSRKSIKWCSQKRLWSAIFTPMMKM